MCCIAAGRSHSPPDLDRPVLSGNTGQLSFLVSTFSTKPTYCELQHLHNEPDSLLVEQALLPVQAKPVQLVNPCFQCSLLQVPKIASAALLTMTETADKDIIVFTYAPPLACAYSCAEQKLQRAIASCSLL